MLTDDELARELGAAFREQTAGLTYAGRRRPRGRAVAVLPAAAAAIALAAGLGVALHPSPTAAARPAAGLSSGAMVNTTINLDGLTLHYQKRAGSPAPLRAELAVQGLPSGSRPVPLPGTIAKAWVGTDPTSGDNALYVRSRVRNGGRLFAVLSSSWTKEQLIGLLRSGASGQGIRDGSPAGA